MIGQDVIENARMELTDTEAPYRWSDAALLLRLNEAIRHLATFRPSFILRQDAGTGLDQWVVVSGLADLSEEVPFEAMYRGPLADAVVSRALAQDGADAQNNNRAEFYWKRYLEGIG